MKRFRDTDYYINEYGDVFRNGKQLKPNMSRRYNKGVPVKDKYWTISIWKDGKNKTYSIHRLVGELYIPNPDNLPEIDHKDNNRFNNHYTNLEWVTGKENIKRAKDSGIGGHKLTDDEVRYIRQNYKKKSADFSGVKLSQMFNIHESQISRIVRNLWYKDVE
jgi:hypothetical protein